MTDLDRSRPLRTMAEDYAEQVCALDGLHASPSQIALVEQFAHAVAAAVRQELEPYLHHLGSCPKRWNPNVHHMGTFQPPRGDCTCGLAALAIPQTDQT